MEIKNPMVSIVRENKPDSIALTKSILKTCGEFILVDRVISESEDSVIAEWHTPTTAYFYRTDDAGIPLLLPGTLMTEHLVQAGELLIYRIRGGRHDGDGVPVLARVRRARFRDIVKPGDVITSTMTLTHSLEPAYYVSAVAKVGDIVVANAELTFTASKAIEDIRLS
jgi:3-hydroxyacyl-[acyl-carrier-protein] dehydratase